MRLALLASLTFLVACGQTTSTTKRLNLNGSGTKTILVTGQVNVADLRAQAHAKGVTVEGKVILKLSGNTDALNSLDLSIESLAVEDVVLEIPREEAFKIADGALYQAKKDFGILELWKTTPAADGRGVTVGVFDDGISPNQSGFLLTTTGERKFLNRASPSKLAQVTLDATTLEAVLDEERLGPDGTLDLNVDGKNSKLKVRLDGNKICLDLNADEVISTEECKGDFKTSGDYFLSQDGRSSFIASYNLEKLSVTFSQPELGNDSHGEGVATVMAGHQIGGIPGMDGVAPGSKIVDWDLSEKILEASEGEYTMGNILMGLEWLAQNGAEVANISYSLFFSSVKAQDFMSKAIDDLVKKYNIVLSFSAGNNGPGLGSLNRKVIYPDSVLVAGAFVSKELDSNVWGVSGLPDEGRVVFYSSRGPGPLGDHGPMLISPLSSLTHSTPADGYRAFSGTSSAAPALAGAAAVLISALKLEGVAIDAPTIVQALRLSGQRLKAEPFVAQGYGLPQVPKAIEIYKNLISGRQFMNVTIRTNKGSQDGIGGRGVLYLTSQNSAIESVRVSLTGVISKLAPKTSSMDLLTPVKLIYSAGLTGSENLWIASATSRVDVDVNLAEVLASGSNGEGFGEIKILDAKTNQQLAIVPVTVLDDKNALQRRRVRLSVSSQGSARVHLNMPAGLNALRVRLQLLEGEGSGLSVSTFDSHRIRKNSVPFTDELWMSTERAGHHQVAISMNGGTGREAVVEVEFEPLMVELKTKSTSAEKPKLNLKSLSASSLFAKLELKPVSTHLHSVLSEIGGEVKPLEYTMTVKEKISLAVEIRAQESADMSYPSNNCSTVIKASEGTVTFGGASFTSEDDKEKTITFRCLPFDHGITKTHGQGWEMEILKTFEAVETKDFATTPRSSTEVSFSKQAAGRYEVIMNPQLGDQPLKIGEVDLI
jgi:subtilisin family serine protease